MSTAFTVPEILRGTLPMHGPGLRVHITPNTYHKASHTLGLVFPVLVNLSQTFRLLKPASTLLAHITGYNLHHSPIGHIELDKY